MQKNNVSIMDAEFIKIIRKNISVFLQGCAEEFDKPGLLLDIAPQVHEGAAAYFTQAKIYILDKDPRAKVTYCADICENNEEILPAHSFDFIVCTEVLEHVAQPFAAIEEMYRILKPGALIFLSTPFNFRIHGPLPDCWRFTEHGLRILLKKFSILRLEEKKTEGRDLMPIHYTVVVRK